MRTSELIKALDIYLKQITINCPYPSVIVQSCNFSQPLFGQDGEMMFAPFVDGAHLVRPTNVVNFGESVLFSQFWQENRLKD